MDDHLQSWDVTVGIKNQLSAESHVRWVSIKLELYSGENGNFMLLTIVGRTQLTTWSAQTSETSVTSSSIYESESGKYIRTYREKNCEASGSSIYEIYIIELNS